METIFYLVGITIFHTVLFVLGLFILYKAFSWVVMVCSSGPVYQCQREARRLIRRARRADTEEQLVGVYRDAEKFRVKWKGRLGKDAPLSDVYYIGIMEAINKRDEIFS
jgi:biopolymer transport protein ExbB/TolQ